MPLDNNDKQWLEKQFESNAETIFHATHELVDEKLDELKQGLVTDITKSVRSVVMDAVDKLTKTDAPTAIAERLRQHHRWLKELAEKIGIELES